MKIETVMIIVRGSIRNSSREEKRELTTSIMISIDNTREEKEIADEIGLKVRELIAELSEKT